jgi:hypothetical protein
MKKNLLYSGILAAIAPVVFAMTSSQPAIVGSISPADGVESVWAVSKTDSVKAVVINTGSFSMSVRPGIYKVIVDAKAPYKDVVLSNIDVKDQLMDVGEIVLQK